MKRYTFHLAKNALKNNTKTIKYFNVIQFILKTNQKYDLGITIIANFSVLLAQSKKFLDI